MTKNVKKVSALAIMLLTVLTFSGCINTGSSNKETNTKNGHQGIFKTTDGGLTWEQKVKVDEKTSLEKLKISSLKMDPQNNKVLYAGTIGGGLYKTEDGADSWKKVTDTNNIVNDKMTVNDIAIEKTNSKIIYVAVMNKSQGELLKSEDGGVSWVEAYLIPQLNRPINHIEIDPVSKNIVYIGTEQGGLLKSEDRGKEWYTISWFKTPVKDFVIDYNNTKGIIVRTQKDILKSVDSGGTWEVIDKDISRSSKTNVSISRISSTTMDNQNPLVVYFTYLNLILLTRDGGGHWDKLNTITPARTAKGSMPQIKELGMIDNIMYYGAGNVLYKSNNKGETWSSYDIPIKGDVLYAVSDYTDSNTFYIAAVYTPPKKK